MKKIDDKKKISLNIAESFKSKKFKYGGYATVITLILIAALVIVNLVADLVPVRIDLTTNKLYSLSEQTTEILENLDKDVTIYYIGEQGSANPVIEEIVQRYARLSSHIRSDYIDPVRDPLTAQKYTKDNNSLSTGNILVECGDLFRVISQYEMYNFRQSQTTGEYQVESLAVEQRLTSAILFVTGAETPVAYELQGHGEKSLTYNTKRQMELENFEVKSLTLLGLDAVPEDAGLLIVNGPQRDLTDDELDVLKEYLANGGKMLFMMDLLINELPKFQELLETYGIGLTNTMVIEGEPGKFIGGNPLYVIPTYGSHEIINPIKNNNLPMFLPGAHALKEAETLRTTLTIETLLETSDKAFGRPATSSDTSLEKQAGDLEGPLKLAVAIEDNVYNLAANETYKARLVVIGNSDFLDVGLEGGSNLFMNSLNWIYERKDTISIRPKSLTYQPLTVTGMQLRIYGALALIIVPLICLIAGLAVWLRRRNL
ncbi:MAG: GldG family protein [Clostridiales bacterium]|nr:GldG family protein [Clostridiales bacterium]